MNRHVFALTRRKGEVEAVVEKVCMHWLVPLYGQRILFLVLMVMGNVFSTVALAEDENLQSTSNPSEFVRNLYDYGCGAYSDDSALLFRLITPWYSD